MFRVKFVLASSISCSNLIFNVHLLCSVCSSSWCWIESDMMVFFSRFFFYCVRCVVRPGVELNQTQHDDFFLYMFFFFQFQSLFSMLRWCRSFTRMIGEAAAPEVLRRDQPRHGQVLLHGWRHPQGVGPGRGGDPHRVGQSRHKQVRVLYVLRAVSQREVETDLFLLYFGSD